MLAQLTHYNTILKTPKHKVVLLCENVDSPANIGGLFRLADSFGVQKIIFTGTTVDLKSPRLKRTARSTQNWVVMEQYKTATSALQMLKEQKYTAIALEITDKSIPVSQLQINSAEKLVLVIGNENTGVSEEVLLACNKQVHIPMFGKNSSMNVTQATAIALYELTKQNTYEK